MLGRSSCFTTTGILYYCIVTPSTGSIYTLRVGANILSFIKKILVLKSYQVVTVKKKNKHKKPSTPPPQSYMVTMFDTGSGARVQVQPCKVLSAPQAGAPAGGCGSSRAGSGLHPRLACTRFATHALHQSPILHPQAPGRGKDQALHRRHRVRSVRVSRAGVAASSPVHTAMATQETNSYRNYL